MFAVIKTGGKQYRIAADQTLAVEKLAGEAGESVTFSEVLMLGGEQPEIGAPFVTGASVLAEIVEHKRGRKVIVFKKRRRQNSRRRNGHRQDFTLVRITDILAAGQRSDPARSRRAIAAADAGSMSSADALPGEGEIAAVRAPQSGEPAASNGGAAAASTTDAGPDGLSGQVAQDI